MVGGCVVCGPRFDVFLGDVMEIEYITSRNNPYIKDIVGLRDRKQRKTDKKFFFEGKKLFEEALKNHLEIESVLMTEQVLSGYSLDGYNFRVICVSDEVYAKISEEKSPEGVLCVSKTLDKFHNSYIMYNNVGFSKERIIILDGIRDPGNLGTILRSASAFGIDNVIMSADCADIYNGRTIRSAMGAVFRQRSASVKDMPGTIKSLRESGYRVLGAALDKNSVCVKNINWDEKIVLVIGNEGVGIRREVLDCCNGTVKIPMESGSESLNASVAASILMWETYKNG